MIFLLLKRDFLANGAKKSTHSTAYATSVSFYFMKCKLKIYGAK